MKAIIYQPSKTVTQSGRGHDNQWVLEYDASVQRRPEALNGWTSADSTTDQIRVKFSSLDLAKKFAEDNGLSYFVKAASQRKVRPRNYGDNFKYVPFEDSAK